MKAIVLAAGVGRRFGERTKQIPKCLIPIHGKSLLARYFEAFRKTGVREAVIVVGHLAPQVRAEARRNAAGVRVRFVTNREYRRGSVVSLRSASAELEGGAVIMDADVFFPVKAFKRLLQSRRSAFLLDSRSKSAGEEMMVLARNGRPWKISKKPDPSLTALGEATGLFRLDARDVPLLQALLEDFYKRGVCDVEYEDSYSELAKRRILGTVSIGDSFWSEMDFEEDLERISAHLSALSGSSIRKNPIRPVRPRSTKAAARA